MIPRVAIVGRPNVGKSSLFNMFCGRDISIVEPSPGVTRDRVSAFVDVPAPGGTRKRPRSRTIELVDTGGHGIEDVQDLTAEVERQIAVALAEANLVVMVVDVQAGITPLDRKVARLLRSGDSPAPVLLVANKVDSPELESAVFEAMELGLGEPLPVSATSRLGSAVVLETIGEMLESALPIETGGEQETADRGLHVAIVGKRNAGKSTLVNALAGMERVIVSELEGTTRDSVDVRFQIGERVFTAIDTAGVRKRKSIQNDIEFYGYHRSLRSIRRADVVVLLIDARVPLSQVDNQLAHEIQKHHKPCILAINKWDLVRESSTQEDYLAYIEDALPGLSYAPIAFLSATSGEGVQELAALVANLHEQAGHRMGTGELNRLLEEIFAAHAPVSRGGKRGRVFYATQVETCPPTIALWVNDPDLFDHTYQRFLLNRLRDEVPFSEVPIRLIFRARGRHHKDAAEHA